MYKAILFTGDGVWTTDFKSKTKEEVEKKLSEKGSMYYFIPFEGIIVDKGSTNENQRVIEMGYPLEFLKGKTIRAIKKWLQSQSDEDLYNYINS